MIAVSGALHGACTRRQARACLGEHGLRAAIRDGRLRLLWPGVLVEPTRRLDPRTAAAAALLLAGPSAVLTGPTAAWLHGCTAAGHPDSHLLLPYDEWLRRRPGLVVHHGRWSEYDVEEVDGLPVLVLDHVISELLCTANRRTALGCADQALAGRPESLRADFRREVQTRLDLRDDRRGTRRAAALLDLATGRAESPPESWLVLIVVDAGFPPPEAQHPVRNSDGSVRYRLDLSWPELMIAIEYDGYVPHLGRAEADAAREEDLRRRGWTVLRANADDLRDPGRLLDGLQNAFAQRRR